MVKAMPFYLLLASVLLTVKGFGSNIIPGIKFHSYVGLKEIKNYTPEIYNSLEQNWCILQDQRGIIYAANQGGILEYDGVNWRRISIPNALVRSLCLAGNGIIYVGGRNQIGQLETQSNGELHYTSLMNSLDNQHIKFLDVYHIFSSGNTLWFRTDEYYILLNWQDGKFDYFDCKSKLFKWNDKIYTQKENIGLVQIINKEFEPAPGGQIFAGKKIRVLIPYGNDNREMLIGTQDNGFFLYDGINAVPFPTEIDDYVKNAKLSFGSALSYGNFAIGTTYGGLAIINGKGKLLGIFNKASGLKDNDVKYIFEDSTQNLWLALNNSISKIDYASPISFFDDRSGLEGLVLSAVNHKNRLYTGTSSGLYYLESAAPGLPTTCKPVPGISGYCMSLLSSDDYLLAATDKGVFVLDNNQSVQKISNEKANTLIISHIFPGYIWIGENNGLKSLYCQNGNWKIESNDAAKSLDVYSIVEDDIGNLWLGTLTKGVVKIIFQGNFRNYRVINCSNNSGLPEGEIYVAMINGQVIFATNKGLYGFYEKEGKFKPTPLLGKEFCDGSRNVFRLVEDLNRHIWFHSLNMNFHAVPSYGSSGNTYALADDPFNRFPNTQVNAIYPVEVEKEVWFGSNRGLIRYDLIVPRKVYRRSFKTLIRKVITGDGTIIYGGSRKEHNSKPGSIKFAYKDRNLRFEAAAPHFDDESKTLFRFYLEGMDSKDQWTEWNADAAKNYMNLYEGDYTLRVQAKNVYGVEFDQDTFSFRVLPPLWRTWWALLSYAVLIMLIIYLIVKWRSRLLIVEKQRLERIVEDRTREINQANIRLQEMDKMKSRFFANISHEFRTPLTLIMGPLDQIRSEQPTKGFKKRIDLIYRNAQRLLGLINQLLDLSKLESGKMKLQAVQLDLAPFLKAIMEPFHLVASKNRLNLSFSPSPGSIIAYFDPEKLEKIISNLLSNAIKFTPPGGNITVATTLFPAFFPAGEQKIAGETANFNSGYVTISVKDTGRGIPGDQLVHLFERFYQANATIEHHRKGSGIGLALTRELVELHHGVITVLSKVGENSGTEFDVRLPLGKEHLRTDEIVEKHCPSLAEEEKLVLQSETLEASVDAECMVEGKNGIEPDIDDDVPDESDHGEKEKNIILIVEDSADLRYYIRSSLEPDFIIEEAGDGNEGIEKAKTIIPDLIVSDIMMPGIDGYELCRIVKNDISTSHVPVVLLTAKASEENIIQGFETGADDYITKPFNTRLLSARIKNIIELRRQLQLNVNREMVLQPSSIKVSKIDREFLDDLQKVIEKNLSNSDLNVEDLSKRLYMSRTTLYRKILALTGETPTDFIRTCRLKKAAQMLKNNYGSVTEVAFEVGFSSRAYFTKCFREKFHRLPSDYFSSESVSP